MGLNCAKVQTDCDDCVATKVCEAHQAMLQGLVIFLRTITPDYLTVEHISLSSKCRHKHAKETDTRAPHNF